MSSRKGSRGAGLGTLIASLMFCVSCASTSLTTWADPNARNEPLRKIAVFGMFHKLRARIAFERAMVEKLRKNGIEAVASLDLVSPDTNLRERKEEVKRLTTEAGADGVLTCKVLSVDTELAYAPGADYYYYDYYWQYTDVFSSPGYITSFTVVTIDTRLYNNTTDRLVWAGESETYNADSLDDIARELSGRVAASLAKAGLIAKKPEVR